MSENLAAGIFVGTALALTVCAKLRRSAETREKQAKNAKINAYEEITDEDLRFVEIARGVVNNTPRPIHSDFLVAACISYWDKEGQVRWVTGANTETCVIPSAICAERSALVQLRLKPHGYRSIKTVYITATADTLITPGVLCREFMCEFGGPETRVFLFTPDWRAAADETGLSRRPSSRVAARGQHRIYLLDQLYPHAPIYHRVPRADVLTQARVFAARMTPFASSALDVRGLPHKPQSALADRIAAAVAAPGADAGAALCVVEEALVSLHAELRRIAARTPTSTRCVICACPASPCASSGESGTLSETASSVTASPAAAAGPSPSPCPCSCGASALGVAPGNDTLHPIYLAAGILMDDGSTVTARQDLCLEYGCTVQAPTKLIEPLRAAIAAGAKPLVMLHVDQHGICHAPYAQSRAWYFEYGFERLTMYVHAKDGKLIRTSIGPLCPDVPRIAL